MGTILSLQSQNKFVKRIGLIHFSAGDITSFTMKEKTKEIADVGKPGTKMTEIIFFLYLGERKKTLSPIYRYSL